MSIRTDGNVVVALRDRNRLHGALVLALRPARATDPQASTSCAPWVSWGDRDRSGGPARAERLGGRCAAARHAAGRPTGRRPLRRRHDLPSRVATLEVGGDWYDAFWTDDRTLAVAVGDVVGRGLRAATAMGQLRTAVRAVAEPGFGPAGVLDRLDRFVTASGVGFMTTLAYAEVSVDTGQVRYACAGHLPPLRLTSDGSSATYLWKVGRCRSGWGEDPSARRGNQARPRGPAAPLHRRCRRAP
ncbi:PP2C family protein-serine/threonine phosphatase [Oerskovia sp. M15]